MMSIAGNFVVPISNLTVILMSCVYSLSMDGNWFDAVNFLKTHNRASAGFASAAVLPRAMPKMLSWHPMVRLC